VIRLFEPKPKEIKKKAKTNTDRQKKQSKWMRKENTSNKFAALVVGFFSRLGVLRAGVQIKQKKQKKKLPHYIIILFWLVSRQPSDELFWQVSARHLLALKECLKASNVVKFTQRYQLLLRLSKVPLHLDKLRAQNNSTKGTEGQRKQNGHFFSTLSLPKRRITFLFFSKPTETITE
jgi:hypothetical protein